MRTRNLAALALVLALASAAAAAPYPTNVCVAGKQKAAGKYCKSVLRAWAGWDLGQDDAQRDAQLAAAATRVDQKWAQAEGRATTAGVDCADTTTSAAGASG